MNKFKGQPLNIQFTHIDNDNIHKTIARCVIHEENLPDIISYKLYHLDNNTLFAECVCRDNDKFDKDMGEKIARKKLMRKFLTLVNELVNVDICVAKEQLKTLQYHIHVLKDIRGSIHDSRNKIENYLNEFCGMSYGKN